MTTPSRPLAAAQEYPDSNYITARDFLSSLFEDKPETHFVTIATFNPGQFFHTLSIEAAVEEAYRRVFAKQDVYYAPGLQSRTLKKTQKGGVEDVCSLIAFWLDVDVLDPVAHKAKNLPPTPEDARQIIALFPISPTFLVWSGHGWQALWRLKEPWVFQSDEERNQARTLLRRFQYFFRIRALQQWRWLVDQTANLDRVLRMPGSVNWKDPNKPALVKIVEETATRLDPSEITNVLDELGVPEIEEEECARRKENFSLVDVKRVVQGCAWLRHCRVDARVLPEPEWYAAVGILGRCQDGEKLAHTWSAPHPGYSREETAKKLKHALTSAGPRTCQYVRYELGAESYCSQCPYWSRIKSPISLGLSAQDTTTQKENKSAADLIIRLASAIAATDHFAQDAGGKLYVYANGAYTPRGEQHIRRRVKALLVSWEESHLWTSHRAQEVVEYLLTDAPTLWERPPLDTINLLNGLLDLRLQKLRPLSPDWLSPVQLPVHYNPTAKCPAWDKFVRQTFPKDARKLAYEIPADLMTPDRSQHKAILLTGEGGNGKSTYLAAVAAFVGHANVASLSLQKIESDRFAAARLVGKLANICPDLPSTHLIGTSVFKAITGGDSIVGEYKYHDSFDFTPHVRLLFSANRPPQSGDDSEGFFQRWSVVPFERTFRNTGKEIPRRVLDARLADPKELSGVLNKALAVLPALRRRGFTQSESIRKAWEAFRQATDPMAIWLEKNTIEHPDALVPKQALLAAYNVDCERERRPRLTQQAFGRALKRLRPNIQEAQRTIFDKVTWAWVGVGLKTSEPPLVDPPPQSAPSHGSTHAEEASDSRTSRDSRDSSNCLGFGVFGEGIEEERGGEARNNNRGKPVKPVKGVNAGDELEKQEGEL